MTFSFAWLRWRMLASSGPRNFNLNSSSHSLNSNRPRRCRGGRDESEGGGGSRVDFSIFKACTAAIAAFFLASSAVLPAIGSKCLSPTSSSASQQNSVSRTWYESRQGPSSRGNRLSLRCGCRSKRLASWHGKKLKWLLTVWVYGKTKEGPKHPKTFEKTTANPTWVSWSSHFLKCCRLGNANEKSLAISAMNTVMRKCFSFLLITFSFAWLRWRMRWMLASSGPRNFNLNSSSHSLNSNRPRRCRGGRDESEGGGGSRVDFSIFKACTAAIAAFFLASSAVLPAIGSKCLSPTSSSASQQNSVSRTWYESRQGPSSRGNRLSLRCGCRSKRLASWHGKKLKWLLTVWVYGLRMFTVKPKKARNIRKHLKKPLQILPGSVDLPIFWSVAGLAQRKREITGHQRDEKCHANTG